MTRTPLRFLAAAAVFACAAIGVSPADAADSERPRIGLVLAGGGAKGGAHVGVLKVLEEMRVPVDCVAGTSMGALIGAGYASGQPAAEVEKFISGIDWAAVVGGAGRRNLEPIEQKRLATEASTGIELGLRQKALVAPGGLSDSSAIDDLLRKYIARSRMVADFNQLPIPYRAVATDMITGDMVVLERGDLATAMRASMAIPGAFSPVHYDNYILADGGMVRNIPVDVARATCADVVIVVNLVEPRTPPEKLVQATQLLARSMSVMLEANEKIQLQTLTERDVRIDVNMGDIGTGDFDRVPETIPLGEQAARGAAARLAELALPEPEYLAWRARVNMAQTVETRIADVRFEGLSRVNPEYLRGFTSINSGDVVDIEAISHDARRMSALEDIESVSYRLEGELDNATLVWLPKEISIGADVLRPSLGLFGDGGGDLKFQIGLQHVRHWLNDRGGQWRNNLELGYESQIATSLYQPFDHAQRVFVEPAAFVRRSVEDLYSDGDRIATYGFLDYGGQVELGWNATQNSQLRVGYLATQRRAKVITGDQELPDDRELDAGITASLRYDSRDAYTFATRGLSAAVEYRQMEDAFGSDRTWKRLEAGLRRAIAIGDDLVWVSLAGGTDLGDGLPPDRLFSLGGPRTLPAYQHDSLRVSEYWLAEASYIWRLKDLVPIRNQAIYGGFGVQAAGIDGRLDEFDNSEEEIFGVSAYLAGPTPIGTFTLGLAGAEHEWSVWLSIGRPIGKGSILDDGQFR